MFIALTVPLVSLPSDHRGLRRFQIEVDRVRDAVADLLHQPTGFHAIEFFHSSNARECFISVFAGRIADTGRDPVPVVTRSLAILRDLPQARVIWASPRELLNIFQADAIGCHVITATADVLNKLSLVGKDLTAFSLETADMFHKDAAAAGYAIPLPASARTGS